MLPAADRHPEARRQPGVLLHGADQDSPILELPDQGSDRLSGVDQEEVRLARPDFEAERRQAWNRNGFSEASMRRVSSRNDGSLSAAIAMRSLTALTVNGP